MSERWQRLLQLFEVALECTGTARDELLAALPAAERARLERLLAADAAGLDGLDGSAFALARIEGPPLAPGERAGVWEILGELGRGGMGWVYLARRADGLYEQRVAVKCLDGALGDADLLARFADERSILAALEHPGIARLLDAGNLADGTSYLVLEHVPGLPIDQHCALHRLDAAARLELVERVCAVVEFAHRRLVVHCDLKPSNVLVTAEGEVKLLDFGIARLLAGSRGEELAIAGCPTPRARRLTPAFASPEQARGETLTTASDVYSLGALLYCLLTGRPPIEVEASTPEPLARGLTDRQPAPPSRLAELPRSWRQDIDAIMERAMAKRPAERYASAEAFAEDLRRLRRGYPVAARPTSWSCRADRFVRRHPLGSLAALLALTAAIVGVWRLDHERQVAERERGTAVRVADFLASFFRGANPAEDEAGALFTGGAAARDARELLLDEGAARSRVELAADPLVKARLLLEIGNAYRQLGATAKAAPLFEEALEIRREMLPRSVAAHAEPLLALCRTRLAEGKIEAAEALCREALEGRRESFGDSHPAAAEVVNELGLIARARGDLGAATALFETSLRWRRQALPAGHRDVETSLNNLALALQEGRDAANAERLLREVLAARRARLSPDHLLIAHALNNLASVLQDLERPNEAAVLYGEALERASRSLGTAHPFVATLHNNLGALRLGERDARGAREHFAEALRIAEQARGAAHPEVASAHHNLGVAWHHLGDAANARRHLTAALTLRRASLGVAHPEVSASLFALVAVELESGAAAAAEQVLRAALGDWAAAAAEPSWAPPYAEALVGRCRLLRHDLASARHYLEHARAGLEAAGHGAETPLGRTVDGWLAELPQPPGTPRLTWRSETP